MYLRQNHSSTERQKLDQAHDQDCIDYYIYYLWDIWVIWGNIDEIDWNSMEDMQIRCESNNSNTLPCLASVQWNKWKALISAADVLKGHLVW